MAESKVQCPGCGCFGGRALSCLPRALVSRLLRDRVRRRYERGEPVFYERTPALAVYSIDSGRVRLSRSGRCGEVSTGVRVAGDLLAARAVLGSFPLGVTGRTVEPATICTIPKATFLDLVRSSPDFAIHLLKHLALEFLLTEEQLAARTQESVGMRIARLLSSLVPPLDTALPSTGATVRMDRHQMAVLVGTTRETLSRTLNQMARRRILALSRTGIQILDPCALRKQFE